MDGGIRVENIELRVPSGIFIESGPRHCRAHDGAVEKRSRGTVAGVLLVRERSSPEPFPSFNCGGIVKNHIGKQPAVSLTPRLDMNACKPGNITELRTPNADLHRNTVTPGRR